MDLTAEAESRMAVAAREFGTQIRRRRRELRMTQEDLALATGVTRHFIMDLESGKPTCYLGQTLLVASGLGLSLELVGQVGTPTVTQSDPEPDLPDIENDAEAGGSNAPRLL
jgi:transcriptional regulator with XRE-family HTH domain